MTINPTNGTWLEIKAWAEAQIKSDSADLENPIFYPGSDNVLRGRIAALRDLLNLPNAGIKKPAFPDSPTYGN